MSEPRPVTTRGNLYGKLSSWVVVAVAIAAFVAGGVGLILAWWWLFYAMAGVFVTCVLVGAAVGIMEDTVGWTTPLPPGKRTVLGAAESTRPGQSDRPARSATSNASQPDVPDEFGEHPG